ncbi:hypothetical protein LMG31886_01030 [Xanthomonas hydrangeae]|uniref:hypothetical protein n=1 Tax=Xanthomonas hydrangeae TaxID=2775159 RepID=UPI001962791D|nr:hypothetical protein LMG31884_01020 [Xanthomonas hydrangeae]CAD7712446.1 hypothetical protein LMG31884_01020 [Xanthomonas hydrangeae]CAD7717465.1 hypothetical protein LMG31887_01020 [Xanthomonas hydrangeae]CAD7717467.1 hypothetical protein LMG31887_01020 [Xanthomonas hydrangeae]CAD7720155.1 hypothetical protein LMG31886_01030 [Xanthomonas hydrangeae]
MIVIDHAPADWFLLRNGDSDWLDINCAISATGFSILLRLNATGQADVTADGHAACARLAAQVQWQPHAFAVRDVSASHGAQVTAAVQTWRAAETRTARA